MKIMNYSNLYPYRPFRLVAFIFMTSILLTNQAAIGMGLLTPVHLYHTARTSQAEQQTKQRTTLTANAARKDMTKGYWVSQQTRDKYCVRFKEKESKENDYQNWGWSMSRCFDKNLFEKKQNDVFELKREAGTLTLSGRLDEEKSEGTYVFTEDSSFKKYLSDNNIESDDENLMFHLYLADVNKQYVEFLKSHYAQIEGNRLLELAIHGVTLGSYQAYINLFEKYSNKKPSIQEVIESKIHGIDQEFVENIQASGYKNLSMRKMTEAKIHGINAAYIDMLKKEGFSDLSIDKIIEAKIHGISSAFITGAKSMGYTNLSLDKIIEAKIHGVNTAYIQELEKSGFSNLPINKLIEAKIHGVNGQFIEEARSKGYKLESISQYIDLKIHGYNRTSRKD